MLLLIAIALGAAATLAPQAIKKLHACRSRVDVTSMLTRLI
jgi:hypothetical protein